MTTDEEFKASLLKVAGELREIANELKEESFTKKASVDEEFSMGRIGKPNPAADPLYEFCMS